METKRVCLFVFLCLGIKIKQIMENLKTFSQKLRNAPLTTALTVDLQVSYTLCMVLYVQRCLRLSSRSVDMWFGTLPSDWTRFCHLLMSPAVQECAGPGVDASLR